MFSTVKSCKPLVFLGLAAMCSCGVFGTTDKWQFVYSTY